MILRHLSMHIKLFGNDLAIGSDYFMAIKKHLVSISNIQQQQFIFKLDNKGLLLLHKRKMAIRHIVCKSKDQSTEKVLLLLD